MSSLNLRQFGNKQSLMLIFAGIIGALLGVTAFAGGLSYADKPSFCGSCHSMFNVYTTWQDSNHRQFSCGECHLPQENIAAKLYVKGENGMRHTYHEVMRDYPDTIETTETAKKIASANCLRCHASAVRNTSLAAGGQDCTSCHRQLVHRRILQTKGDHYE